MSLGVVSPIRNKGLYSDWLSAAPLATSMLTIDTSGNVGSQSIPVAAWGSITGTLSTQTDLQNALDAKLSLSGGTMTGTITSTIGTITASTPVLSATQTWNNAAVTFSAMTLNVTDTASAAASLLMDLQVGGSSKLRVDKGGAIRFGSGSNDAAISLALGLMFIDHNLGEIVLRGSSGVWAAQITTLNGGVFNKSLQLSNGGGFSNSSGDVQLWRDAADTLGIRRSTNAQTFRIYGTYTDASNYRRLYLSSTTAGAFTLGVEGAGTGASGNLLDLQVAGASYIKLSSSVQIEVSRSINPNDTGTLDIGNSARYFRTLYSRSFISSGQSLTGSEATSLFDASASWNTTGTVTALKLNITDTASNAASLLLDLQVGGSSKFKIDKAGAVSLTGDLNLGGGSQIQFAASTIIRAISGDGTLRLSNAAANSFSLLQFGGTTSSFPALKRNSAGLEVRLADDSGFATIKGKITTDTNYTAGAPTATGYIVLYDAAGTAYKIPAEAL